MAKNQHCRTHQAVRNRNDMITGHQWDELGPKAERRSQQATDQDTAAYYDRAWQIGRPYGRKQVCERR